VEENKDGNDDVVNQGHMTSWFALGVRILTEHIKPLEKVELLAAAISEVKNVGQAPQEIVNEESFLERLERHL